MNGAFHRLTCRTAQVPGVMTLGHYGWPVLLVAGIGLHCTAPGGAVLAVTVVSLIGGGLAVAAHGGSLLSCGRCRPRLAPPVDAQAAVTRQMWLLRLAHAPWRSRVLWILGAATVATTLWAPGRLEWLSAVPMTALFVLGVLWAPRVHARLEFGCPWCDHGGHGGHRDDPDDDDPPLVPSGPGGLVPDHIEDVIAGWDDVPAIPDPVTSPDTSPVVGPVAERVRVPRPRGTGRGIGGAR